MTMEIITLMMPARALIKKTIKVGTCMHLQVNKNGIGNKMNQSQRKFGQRSNYLVLNSILQPKLDSNC